MNRSQQMGNEVGRLAAALGRVVGCSTCGIGLAIDAVGEHWGEDPYDWGLRRDGHDKICNVSRGGLTRQQDIDARAIIDGFYKIPPALLPDPRLPPERDEEMQ